MPDFERELRSLEQSLAKTPEEAAFIRGKHAGEDRARKQVVWVGLICIAVIVFVAVAAFG